MTYLRLRHNCPISPKSCEPGQQCVPAPGNCAIRVIPPPEGRQSNRSYAMALRPAPVIVGYVKAGVILGT